MTRWLRRWRRDPYRLTDRQLLEGHLEELRNIREALDAIAFGSQPPRVRETLERMAYRRNHNT